MEVFGQDIMVLLSQYGYLAVFLAMMVSGPLVVVVGGFFVSLGVFNPWYLWIVVVIVDLITDTFYYELGRRQGSKVLTKLGRFFRWPDKISQKIEWLFKAHGGKTVFIAKYSHGLGSITQIMAGIAHMNRRVFYAYSMSAAVTRNALYLWIGMLSGSAWQMWANRIEGIAIGIALLLVVFVAGVFLSNKMQKGSFEGSGSNDL